MKSALVLVASFILAVAACKPKANDNTLARIIPKEGKLIPIDFSDTNYREIKSYAMDTITKSGWAIKYMVKNDTTRYNDLYIQWSKGAKVGLFRFEDVLLMRTYFMPVVAGENDNYIFLTHACATECEALLTLSKENIPKAKDFVEVIKFDIKTNRVVFVNEKSSLDTIIITTADLIRNKNKSIKFKNLCGLNPVGGCIDSVRFEKDYVKLMGTFPSGHNTYLKESHIIRLDD